MSMYTICEEQPNRESFPTMHSKQTTSWLVVALRRYWEIVEQTIAKWLWLRIPSCSKTKFRILFEWTAIQKVLGSNPSWTQNFSVHWISLSLSITISHKSRLLRSQYQLYTAQTSYTIWLLRGNSIHTRSCVCYSFYQRSAQLAGPKITLWFPPLLVHGIYVHPHFSSAQ